MQRLILLLLHLAHGTPSGSYDQNSTNPASTRTSFNQEWEFVKGIDSTYHENLVSRKSDAKWERISLPHTANIEPIEKINQQWQGTCFYRKYFTIPPTEKGKHIAVQFDAAMQVANVYLNGKHIFRHAGGYLPFYIDLSDKILFGKENSLLVKLNNEDNTLIPPGKPLKDLDFNYYSGIYRDTWLIVKDPVHISNSISANKTAGGGIFLHYEKISANEATLIVNTQVVNEDRGKSSVKIRTLLKDHEGKTIATADSKTLSISSGSTYTFPQSLTIPNPFLWSPETPYLYELSVEVIRNGKTVDYEIQKTGVKSIHIDKDGFYLNQVKTKIRGTNRHQEYPYIGYALSDNAQYRDAWKIKAAGFNFVRTSHYPQSPAFLEACDELGIMVMDAIPGWQFPGNKVFQEHSFRDAHEMIRRDRNHASIVLWEASLNESGMKVDYMQKAHDIVHAELPFPDIYSAGWIDTVYDVFLPARQHAKAPDYWSKRKKLRPFLIAEYGDWEYYAQNAGFNQTAYQDLKEEERTSRQLRKFGEKGLLQQALNFQEAHNDDLYSNAIGDANWLMFDYNRGYATDIESSGIMEITRLPKFSFYFYQSQIDPVVNGLSPFTAPMLFIANYFEKASTTAVRIFSNCEEVELTLNGKLIARQRPDKDKYSTNLKHPPFTFNVPANSSGTLMAVGYVASRKVTEQAIQTPGVPTAIRLRADISGKELEVLKNDLIFIYAEVTDSNGTIVRDATDDMEFKVTDGDAEIMGTSMVKAEAGIAAILLRAGSRLGDITVICRSKNFPDSYLELKAR
jgi:beta-galactosidase